MMAKVVEDFILKFQSLDGHTIADKKKNFFKLLHQTTSLKNNIEALDSISAHLTPKTYLESLFKVDFLIYFRRTEELHHLLKEGNDVVVSKIAKQIWFFKESFNEIGAHELVNETLPCMSFTVRMKVLRKLSRYLSSDKFDEIFDAVAARYGIFIALQFVTGCSPLKVKQILVDHPVTLTSTQLKILYEKDPTIIDYYFSHRDNSISLSAYKSLIKFILNKDQDLYNFLKEKYRISLKLGRRATKKVIIAKRNEIIEYPSSFNSILSMKTVIRKLGKDSVRLFCNALAASYEKCNLNWLLGIFPKRYHYDLYFKTIQAYYNMKFIDCPKFIDESLLRLVSENSERALLAKAKVDQGCDDYLKYLTIQDSIPLIKEKINLTSDIYERGKLVQYLIESCHINNDLDALLLVMKYFCFRHKNDELNVHLQFIRQIESLFGFKKFTEEMWNCLNELLLIHTLKYDQTSSTYQKIQTLPLVSFNLGTSSYQKLSYLEFLFKRDQTINELITEYCSTNSEFPQCSKYDEKFVKYFLLDVVKQREISLDENEINYTCRLIEEIESWNCYNKNDQICFYDFPALADAFNYVIMNKFSGRFGSFSKIRREFRSKIFTTNDNTYKCEYMKMYWKCFDYFGSLSDLKWFLKYDPFIIINNFDTVFKTLTDNNSIARLKVWYVIKKFSHLQLDRKSVELCLSKLSEDSCLEIKPKLVTCLSVLMKPADYAAFADSYKPANKKLDLKNETEIRLYNLQCSIATEFKNTKSYEVLSSLLNYCAGDFLKYSMKSLYSILYRTPENMLPQYLNYLSKKAVSVRKHALFLTCELSTSTNVEQMIKQLNQQEEVQSLQKHMFSATIKYFVKNPSDPFFELIKLNMLFINKADEESLNSIAQRVNEIPTHYRAQYVQYSWEYFEKTVDILHKLLRLKASLLSSMDREIIKQISANFGMKIIEQHFMASNDVSGYFYGLNEFIFIFVESCEEKGPIFEKIFNTLHEVKDQDKVFRFLRGWYNHIMSSKQNDLKYLEPFVNYFESKISVVGNFYNFIKVFFLKAKLETPVVETADDLSAKVITFFQDVVSNYGPHVIHLFGHEMRAQLSFFKNEKVTIYDFYHSMIKNNPVPIVAIMLLDVISEPGYDYDTWKIFNDILKQIKNISDIGVQINLQCKFKSQLLRLGMDTFTSTTAMEVE